jgi:hypothetical protein
MNIAFSAELKDVKILKSSASDSGIELKLQLSDAPKDSFFLVDIVRTDHDAFNKIAMAMEKLEKGSEYKLNIRIPSFSASPSGSYYRSKGLVFSSGE